VSIGFHKNCCEIMVDLIQELMFIGHEGRAAFYGCVSFRDLTFVAGVSDQATKFCDYPLCIAVYSTMLFISACMVHYAEENLTVKFDHKCMVITRQICGFTKRVVEMMASKRSVVPRHISMVELPWLYISALGVCGCW